MSSTINELPTTGIAQPAAVAGPGSMPSMPDMTPARKAWVENVTILLAHKNLILWTTLAVTAITAIYAFGFMPNYYKSTAVVLPARKPGGGLDNMASSLTSSLKDLGLAKLSGGEESYTPLSLMTSRELQEGLVRQFGLQKVYDADNMEEALKEFNGNLDCELTPEGNFLISFEDTSRVRAAAVANAAVQSLNELNSRMAKEEARHNSRYMEERYALNLRQLDSAESALGDFEKKNGIYILQEQARAELGTIAAMEQQKSMAEIELKNVLEMYGSNAAEASSLRNSINGIEQKLDQMRTGQDARASSFVPTNILPEAALQFLRLTREVEIQSKLKAFFLPLYEQARLDENRNLLSFVVMDHAIPAERKSRPRRSILILVALIGSFVTTAIMIFVSARTRDYKRAVLFPNTTRNT
jgi:capsule polysaccharide export protein KpsE/RkpR